MNKDITNTTLLMIAELAGEHTMPDGRKVQITVVEQAKTETEVSAKFEDCFDRVEPVFYIDNRNHVIKATKFDNTPEEYNAVPTERNAKQLQAFAKLLVIMHDLNGGEWIPKHREDVYCVSYEKSTNTLKIDDWKHYVPYPIYFRTRELAHKALEANEQIFRDFYGV